MYNAQGHDFITLTPTGDDFSLFTISDHSDFIRAGGTNIGTHVDDTTAANGLDVRYTQPRAPQADGVGGSGNGIRFRDGNVAATVTGDDETAPDHRAAFFGIYGDMGFVSPVIDQTPRGEVRG